MKISDYLRFAAFGWIGALIAIVVLGVIWPRAFPAFIEVNHYYGTGPGLLTTLAFAMIVASPGALIGGVIGGRLPKEGGRTEQLVLAALLGGLLALPLACWTLWGLTGWNQ